MEKTTITYLLQLVKVALKGNVEIEPAMASPNVEELFGLASAQGVKGLVWQGIELQMKANKIQLPKSDILKWFGQVQYLEKVTKKLFLQSSAYADSILPCKCVVLKGLDYARYWPNPWHREYGDLDYYSGEEFDRSNEQAKKVGALVEDGGYKHSHIHYNGLTVENHRYFTDFNATKQGYYTEDLLKKLLDNDMTSINDTALLSPNPTFTATFLLRHAQLHFLGEGIKLRHILDWLFFLRKEQDNVDWDKVLPAMNKMGMLDFAKVMTAICEKYFGWTPSNPKVPTMSIDSPLLVKFFEDTINPQPDVYDMHLHRKAYRILRRSVRMVRFRKLLNESYFSKMWQSLIYNSVTGVRPKISHDNGNQ